MNKRQIALLCIVALLVGVLAFGASATTANDGKYDVGYVKVDVNPWVQTPDISYLHPETGVAGIPDNTAVWLDVAENVFQTQVEEGTVSMIRIPMGGFGSLGAAYSEDMIDDNGDGKISYGDGLAVTVTSVTDDAGTTVMYITIDAVGAYGYLTEELRSRISTALNGKVAAENIMVSANHTHSGINILKCYSDYKHHKQDENGNELKDENGHWIYDHQDENGNPITAWGTYWIYYLETVTDAAVKAYNNATPATMKKGAIDVSEVVGGDLAFVRHYNVTANKKDGSMESAVAGPHFGPSSNDQVTDSVNNFSAVADANNTMSILEFIPADNSDPIVLVNWNAHSTFVGTTTGTVVSSDYASSLRRYMEEAGYKAAFWQGAAGNLVPNSQNPNVTSQSNYWVNYEDSKDAGLDIDQNKKSDAYKVVLYGRLLSMAAEECLDNKMVSAETGEIRTLQTDYSFDMEKPSAGLIAAAKAWEADGKAYETAAFPYSYKHTDGKTYILNSFYHAEKVLELAEKTGNAITYEMNVIMLGDQVGMVTMPVEMFDRYDANGSVADADNDWLELVGETYGTPFVLGYTNEHGGYLPNTAAYNYNAASTTYATGAYEANVTSVAAGCGEEAIAQFKTMLELVANEKQAKCPTCNKTVTWKPLNETGFFNNCTKQTVTLEDGHYYLIEDIDYRYSGTTPQRHQISVSGNLCLDLNGHTINSYSRTLVVNSGATMTLLDSSANPGSIISNNGNNNPDAGVVSVSGTFNLYNATVKGNQTEAEDSNDTARGGAISVTRTGTFNMYSGKVIGTQLLACSNVTVDNGCGGTIYSEGTMNLMGGEVVAGKALSTGYGDCIYIGNNTATTKISGNAKIDEIFFETLTPAKIIVSGTYTGKTSFAYKPTVALAEGLTVATADNANITGMISCSYYVGAVSGNEVVLKASKQAVVGSTAYDKLAEAVAAANGETIKLLTDVKETVPVNCNAVIDLNSCDIATVNVAEGVTLTCYDTATEDYTVADGIYGKITTCSGNVVGAEGYLKVTDNGAASFHKVDLLITAMSLRASVAGVYYKSDFRMDEVAAASVKQYGVALSVKGEPNADNMGKTSAYSYLTNYTNGNVTGTLLKNIMTTDNSNAMNRRNANMTVFGRPYILSTDGEYFFGTTVQRSLKQQLEAIDANWSSYTNAAKETAVRMYMNFGEVMKDWNIPNIKADADPANDGVLKVLVVGNSHGLDATNLLYEVFKDQNPGQKVVLGALYRSGCRMSQHAEYLVNNLANYDYYKNGGSDDQDGEAWTVQKAVTGLVAFEDEQWDIVVMQQMSHRSGHDSADDFNAKHFKAVIDFIYENQFAKPKLAYHMVMATPDGENFIGGYVDDKGTEDTADDTWVKNTKLVQGDINWVRWHQQWYGSGSTGQAYDGSFTSEAMYNGIIACTQKYIVDSTDFLGENYFDFILPTGTAIQYAREALNYETKVSGMPIDPLQSLYRDYTHLSDFGRLIAAYTWYGAIMQEVTGAPVTITNVGIDAISSTLHHKDSAYPALDANGAYTVTSQMKADIISTVNWALAHPFELPKAE